MEGFNKPGSNKSWMDEGFKKHVIQIQLNNIVSILKGKLEYASTYDNTGKITKKIIITYDETNEKVSS
jgi:hypothetical protein